MSELHDLTALEQAAAIRTREISAVELAEHYLARTEALNDTVGAFITVTPEIALEQARTADATVGDCADPDGLPVLHGVVVPVKDLNFQAGVRCTLGSATFDIVPYGDDNVVMRMKQGNLVMTGKTNTPEFGLPCYTENAVAPPARTPWDLTRSAGGSSGGAAAAVASGLAAAAHLPQPCLQRGDRTAVGRFASRQACAASSASSPREAASPTDPCVTRWGSSPSAGPSPAPCVTLPPCWTSWRGPSPMIPIRRRRC